MLLNIWYLDGSVELSVGSREAGKATALTGA